VLVQYGDAERDRRWTFPKELVALATTAVGWHLIATTCSHRPRQEVIYKLKVPKDGTVVKVVEVVPSPFPARVSG